MAYFRFRHQPFRTFYYLYIALSLLIRVPYWTIRYALPSTRPVLSWSLGRVILVKCCRLGMHALFGTTLSPMCFDPVAIEKSGKGEQVGLVWTEPAPDLVVLDEIKEAARINDIKPERTAGYWLGKRGPDGKVGRKAGLDEKVIYGLHGGGFIVGSGHPDFATGIIYRKMFDYAPKGYKRTFMCEYRLSWSDPLPTQGAFPAALFDALAGYQYLVRDLGFKPANILVMGESAGANLALQLTRYLSQVALPTLGAGTDPGAARPRGQLLLSPVADWGHTQEARVVSLVGRLPEAAAWENSWISPGSTRIPRPEGLLKGLPPTCIIIGGAEMILDPVRTLRDRIVADNGEGALTYLEIPNATHVPMSSPWHEPESTQGYEASREFLQSLE